ncbi:terminase [Bifidobacterium ramosum]|uniref:Terminase n=1 Tax=Bifidobacterium ramosum TaxID=1798158 RepID=A0A6L4X2G7_9BIFI|nr:terminase [Bifidobacterium ramosum]NEG71022.1 terminase [Bifidobacterium ramosum]
MTGSAQTIIPDGIVSTAEPALYAFVRSLGFDLDDWQRDINRLLLAKRADGKWAARNGDISIPRQAGKTYDIGFIPFQRCIQQPRFTAIWTTHHFSVTHDTFLTMRDEIVYNDLMLPYIDPVKGVHSAAGQERFEFRNGSTLAFKARENGAIRGFKKVGLIVLDEAQQLSDSALAAVLPTQNRADNPQTIYMGTPPAPDMEGEVFARHRSEALAHKVRNTMYVEFSADRDCDPLDRSQWRKANPSYPNHTSDESILNLYGQFTADNFRRECLGIWDEDATANAIDPKQWDAGVVREPDLDGRVAYGLDMPPDRSALAIGVAVRHGDDTALVNLQEYVDVKRNGIAWAVEWLAERWPKTCAVVVDTQSPAMSLVPDLQKRHVRVTVTQTRDLGAATGRMLDMIHAGTLWHLPADQQPQLDSAARNVTLRDMGPNGMRAWNKKGSDIDISPLQAVTLALHGAFTSKRRPGRKAKAVAL